MSVLLLVAIEPVVAQRVTTSLDAGWRFHLGDVADGQAVAADGAGWLPVTLPHTFNGGDGDHGGGYYRGPGWYRRTLTVLARPPGKRAFLEFDGAALAADVYLNGHLVGNHRGGFARFRFDVTDQLRVGSNELAVRVDNSRDPGIAPLGGDFTVFGGLYRSVSLVETDDVHIDMRDHGGPGVYADVRSLTTAKADIVTNVLLRNDGPETRRTSVLATIYDAAGHSVATGTARVQIGSRTSEAVTVPLRLSGPHLWNGRADPYLYRLAVRVGAGRLSTSPLDEQTIPLGFRSATLDPRRGFLLNGRSYPLHGVDYFHPERPGVGTAVTSAQIDEDVATLVDMGVNSMRLVHFQHPQRVYDDADRLGLPVWTEIPLNGAIDRSPAFRRNVEEQMRELIAQNRNHPSVVLWGIGNEVYATDPAVTDTLRAVQAVAHHEDASRPTVYAHCCQADNDPKAQVSDVIGFNRYFGWYPEQSGSIGSWAGRFHASFPDRSFGVSEFGAGGSILQEQASALAVNNPAGSWHPEQAQTAYHMRNWRELRERPFLFGSYVWVAFDVASDGRHEGERAGINDKGLVTYDRATRKDAFYWYQANWTDHPMVHLLDRRLNVRSAPETAVSVVTNLPLVTLSNNGRVVGEAAVVDHVALFPRVPLATGSNHLVASAASDRQTVVDAVEWTRQEPSAFGVSAVPAATRPADAPKAATAPPGQ